VGQQGEGDEHGQQENEMDVDWSGESNHSSGEGGGVTNKDEGVLRGDNDQSGAVNNDQDQETGDEKEGDGNKGLESLFSRCCIS
jgi:hypothetical protein